MKNTLTFLLLTFSISCLGQIFPFPKNNIDFDVNFEIKKIDKEEFMLSASIELGKENYIISPFSTDGIYGNFSLEIAKNNHVVLNNTIMEIPLSVEELDPIIDKPVRFVRVNTTYQQKIKVQKETDFEVVGLVEFLLEPSCIPWDVEFILSYESGEMKITKTKTSISKEYKL